MSSYKEQTSKSIQQAFTAYHKANPDVYENVKRLAFQAIDKGKQKVSFKLIINVLRWEIYLQTVEPDPPKVKGKAIHFRINDAYHSRYSRMFATDFPEHEPKIDFRELRS